MDLRCQTNDGVLIANPGGRVDGVNSPMFESALISAIESADAAPVVLDCSELSYISSAGMRAILLIAQMLEDQERQLAVCSLSEEIQDLFEICGFDQVIGINESLEQALGAIGNRG